MNYLIFFTTSALILAILARVLYFIQLKEYRFDRFLDFLKYEKGFLKVFPMGIIIFYLLLLFSLYFNQPEFLLSVLAYGLLVFAYITFTKGFFRYKKTVKAHLIFVLSVFPSLILAYFYQVLALFLAPIWMSLLVIIFMPITQKAKDRRIQKAHLKIKSLPNLKVIGITGSFGKSSTKEFLYHLLKDKFNTLKTPKNINTDIGVATHLLSKLKQEHEVYIVEMGAYRPGEIKKICDMVEPSVGILTAIAQQHYSLFKTLENIKNAKAELPRSLPKDGLAILNFDFLACQEISSSLDVPYFSYTSQDIQGNEFTLDEHIFKSDISANFLLPNLLAAAKVAKYLGLTDSEIQEAIDTIPESILPIKSTQKKHCILIDDSYNSNPTGFAKAISLVKSQATSSKKILISRGMIELGDLSEAEHLKIAKLADEVFDEIILVKPEIFSIFKSEVKTAKLTLITDMTRLLNYLQTKLSPEDVVLVENKLNPLVFNYLNQN